ncbi:MAG: DNA repair protein RecN [Verrucomicrobia bacterium]|nr:DNA repair protein RecN [Verrucomicrobiota bacterium]
MPATLRSLRIRNLALVEQLDWELAAGFNVVTGETGAGKSIIIGALKMILGERADKSIIRTGEEQCSVEALFHLQDVDRINTLLAEEGVDPCEDGELLIRRVLSVSGTNRQFINGCQTTLGFLKDVGDGLVDLHGPHDHQSLLSKEYQLRLVDAFAGNENLFRSYPDVFGRWQQTRKELDEFEAETALSNLDLWRHQLTEISSAGVRVGERTELESQYSVAANGRRILELTGGGIALLSESENALLTQLGELARLLRELEKIDGQTHEFVEDHQRATVELEELERSLVSYQQRVDLDPGALQMMEERLNLLERLSRKYGRDEAGLLELAAELETKLSRAEHRESILEKLRLDAQSLQQKVWSLAQQLTRIRHAGAVELAASIRAHLQDLGFAQASFDIVWETLSEPNRTGFDQVEFLFSPNPGEPLKPLRAIASSGEISRVMLAIKTALAQQDLIGLLVFDEIDANVGGEIASAVGKKMQTLGGNRQVVAITHMPQVAAGARTHFFVSKEVIDGRTRTSLQEVQGDERLHELARMLGGRTSSALEHARTLLRGA